MAKALGRVGQLGGRLLAHKTDGVCHIQGTQGRKDWAWEVGCRRERSSYKDPGKPGAK